MAYRFDMHVHSHHSYDCNTSIQRLVKTAIRRGLSGIAVTDHNTIKGGIEAAKYVKTHKLPLQIIVGQELYTKKGEIMAWFLEKELTGKDFFKAVRQVREQGGLLVLPHPFRNRKEILEHAKEFDFIEVSNSKSFNAQNKKARELARSTGARLSAGSDAHWAREIGGSVLVFDSLENIRKQLLAGRYRVLGRERGSFGIILSQTATGCVREGPVFLVKRIIREIKRRV